MAIWGPAPSLSPSQARPDVWGAGRGGTPIWLPTCPSCFMVSSAIDRGAGQEWLSKNGEPHSQGKRYLTGLSVFSPSGSPEYLLQSPLGGLGDGPEWPLGGDG